MFLNEPSAVTFKDLPEQHQQTALDHSFESGSSDKIFHVIDGGLYFENDEHGYGLTLPNELESKYPRFFAEQDVGCTDDAFVTGTTLTPLGFEPADYDTIVVSYLYPDVEPGDWSDLTWA